MIPLQLLIGVFVLFSNANSFHLMDKFEPPCKSNHDHHLYQDPNDCSKFWQCSPKGPYQLSCPDGLVFSFEEQICDLPEVVQCNESPTRGPTYGPTSPPTREPTYGPTSPPTREPTYEPTSPPTREPTYGPTSPPTRGPTYGPTSPPTRGPTYGPTSPPTREPTYEPTSPPTGEPTYGPTNPPTRGPTYGPTSPPTREPTYRPTNQPTRGPTYGPTNPSTRSPTCPDGWTLFAENCYWFAPLDEHVTWISGQGICNSKGGYLLEIKSESEQEFIVTAIKSYHGNEAIYLIFWLGASDSSIEKDWRWHSDKSVIDYSNWGKNYPNQNNEGKDKDCGSLHYRLHSNLSDGQQWKDESCTNTHYFICKM